MLAWCNSSSTSTSAPPQTGTRQPLWPSLRLSLSGAVVARLLATARGQRKVRRRRQRFRSYWGVAIATASSILVFIISFRRRRGMFLIESFPYIFRLTCEFGFYYQRWVNVLPPIFLRDSSFYYPLSLLYVVAASKLLPIFLLWCDSSCCRYFIFLPAVVALCCCIWVIAAHFWVMLMLYILILIHFITQRCCCMLLLLANWSPFFVVMLLL